MHRRSTQIVLLVILLLPGCSQVTAPTAAPVAPTLASTPITNQPRQLLRAEDLMNGFDFEGPVDEAALTPLKEAAPPKHRFEGRLELLGEEDNGYMEVLRGELGPAYASLPEFDFRFVQSDGYIVPVQRGLVITDHPKWNFIFEPGRAWQEADDGGFSRASIPFALIPKGSNSAFNGTLTFLFDGQQVSKVWYQVTQEISTYSRGQWDPTARRPPVDLGAKFVRR